LQSSLIPTMSRSRAEERWHAFPTWGRKSSYCVCRAASADSSATLGSFPRVDWATCGPVRLHAAAHILGAHTVHVLDYPDGRLRWMARLELETEILNALRQHTPDAVITFDEDGLYWHPDHVAVHERTTHAVLSLGAEAPSL
jgi:hypothetical protein